MQLVSYEWYLIWFVRLVGKVNEQVRLLFYGERVLFVVNAKINIKMLKNIFIVRNCLTFKQQCCQCLKGDAFFSYSKMFSFLLPEINSEAKLIQPL